MSGLPTGWTLVTDEEKGFAIALPPGWSEVPRSGGPGDALLHARGPKGEGEFGIGLSTEFANMNWYDTVNEYLDHIFEFWGEDDFRLVRFWAGPAAIDRTDVYGVHDTNFTLLFFAEPRDGRATEVFFVSDHSGEPEVWLSIIASFNPYGPLPPWEAARETG